MKEREIDSYPYATMIRKYWKSLNKTKYIQISVEFILSPPKCDASDATHMCQCSFMHPWYGLE